MLTTLKKARETVIKHIMQRVCAGEFNPDSGLRLIAAFDEEYKLANDSVERFQRACYQITSDKVVVMGGEPK